MICAIEIGHIFGQAEQARCGNVRDLMTSLCSERFPQPPMGQECPWQPWDGQPAVGAPGAPWVKGSDPNPGGRRRGRGRGGGGRCAARRHPTRLVPGRIAHCLDQLPRCPAVRVRTKSDPPPPPSAEGRGVLGRLTQPLPPQKNVRFIFGRLCLSNDDRAGPWLGGRSTWLPVVAGGRWMAP